jgi:hypothetical protein
VGSIERRPGLAGEYKAVILPAFARREPFLGLPHVVGAERPVNVVALGAEFVTQIREWVRLAVLVCGDGSESSSGEIGAVKTRSREFGPQLDDLGYEGGSIGEGRGEGSPDVGGELFGESIDQVARDLVSGDDLR